MTRPPAITAVICTHNRASYLQKALRGLQQQTLATELFEVLVVDNRSTDNTAELLSQEQADMPNLRYCHEAELGLSAARNRGLRESRGEYVAYLDDDAIPGKRWLEAALDTFTGHDDMLGLLGGKVVPIWERERPNWLSDDLLPYLTVIDLGEDEMEVQSTTGIVGANMIFPRAVLEKIGGFPTQLGRKGTNLLSNEELALKEKLQQAGYRAIYHPEVMVRHHAPAERISKQWFLKRLYWQGQSDVIWWKLQSHAGLLRSLGYSLRSLLRTTKALVQQLLRFSSSPGARFQARANTRYHIGAAVGALRPQSRG